jgi:hypothetical protein
VAALDALIGTCEHALHASLIGCPYCQRDTRLRILIAQCVDALDGWRTFVTRPPDERGWVVEKHINGVLHYWNGRACFSLGQLQRGAWWTTAHADAIRFARQEDAAVVLSWLLDGEGRVAEHLWLHPSPKSVESPASSDAVARPDGESHA